MIFFKTSQYFLLWSFQWFDKCIYTSDLNLISQLHQGDQNSLAISSSGRGFQKLGIGRCCRIPLCHGRLDCCQASAHTRQREIKRKTTAHSEQWGATLTRTLCVHKIHNEKLLFFSATANLIAKYHVNRSPGVVGQSDGMVKKSPWLCNLTLGWKKLLKQTIV